MSDYLNTGKCPKCDHKLEVVSHATTSSERKWNKPSKGEKLARESLVEWWHFECPKCHWKGDVTETEMTNVLKQAKIKDDRVFCRNCGLAFSASQAEQVSIEHRLCPKCPECGSIGITTDLRQFDSDDFDYSEDDDGVVNETE